ncbi:MAG: cache domain-containing protein, partial [Elusimicrobiota bacterium]
MLDKIKKIKIFYKFLIVLLAISAVPLFVVGMRLIDINRLSLQDVTLELQTNQASQLALSIENHMKSLRDKIVFVIESQGEPPVDWALSERLLRSMLASSRDLLTVSLVNEDGREITKVFDPALEEYVKLEDRTENEVFINSRESGEASASGLMRDRYNKIPRIDIVYPFAKGIYIYIEANLEDLLEEVKNTTIGNTGFAYVVDSQGRVIMHPNEQKAIDKVSVDDRDIVQAVLSRRMAGSIEFRDPRTEKEIIGAYTPVSSFARLGWGVIIEQEYAEAYSSSIEMRKQALMLLAAVIIAACFIGYFLAQNLTAPILRLTEASRN